MTKSKWELFKQRAGEVLGHPAIQKASDFGNSMLEITANLAENRNPLSVSSAVMASANLIADALDIQLKSPIAHYCDKHGLTPRQGDLHKMLLQSGAENEFRRYRALKYDTMSFECLELSDTSRMYWVFSSGSSIEKYDMYASDNSVASQYWVTEGFDHQLIADYFWRKYPNGMNLSMGTVPGRAVDQQDVKVSGLPPCGVYTDFVANSVSEMVDYVRRSKEAEISRSFLLYGCPGGGKTSFVEKLADSFGRRLIKVESSFLDDTTNSELDSIIDLLRPEVVLFDDFDRIDLDTNEGKFLYITEDLKRKYPRITFFATVNNPGELSPALLRPGRFDEKIKFLPPPPTECIKITSLYAASMGVATSDSELSLAIAGRKFTPAECKEVVSRKMLKPELSMKMIFDDIERYRSFEQSEEVDEFAADDADEEISRGVLAYDADDDAEVRQRLGEMAAVCEDRELKQVIERTLRDIPPAKKPRKPKSAKPRAQQTSRKKR